VWVREVRTSHALEEQFFMDTCASSQMGLVKTPCFIRDVEARGSTSCCQVLVDLVKRLYHRTQLSPT